ncbi:hypothetical protein MAPG_06698 [Magnaporthiopsis poae ATCC 64411]|uniref:Zn(2)-C6 fungal-type domain-containing protein n=1 Tax=Magnaporthiopsis poae (strain ATCC 64411 / 73-15) TaxID=644358 RepID=A0A0C4E2Q8_MAGP6|nr:hypothetical protein MAPG_06698 [Magnaporthiopsis poae ATCC 64411]
MMNSRNTNTLKRRRPHGRGSSPVEHIYQDSTSPGMPASPEAPPLSQADRQYILEQAAQVLGVSVPRLLQFSQPHEQPPSVVEQAAITLEVPVSSLLELGQQHRQKRPRVDTAVSMPPPFTPGRLREPDHAEVDHGPHYKREATHETLTAAPEPTPSLLGLSASRVAGCISSFAVCNACVGFESQDENYPSMPTTASYDYGDGSRLGVVDVTPACTALAPSQTLGYHASTTTAAEAPGLLGCDDAAAMGGYLPQYPALPPSRPPGIEQPHTSGETMLYPVAVTATAYSGSAASTPHPAVVPLQSASQGMVQSTQYVPSSVTAETRLHSQVMAQTTQYAPSPMAAETPLPIQGMEQATQYMPSSTTAVTPLPPQLMGQSTQYVEQTTQYMPSPMTAGTPLPSPSSLVATSDPGPGYGPTASYGPPGSVAGEGSTGAMEVYHGAPELVMMALPQRAPPTKRGPFKDQAEREKTAYTRKIGSCVRCRMQRIRCYVDPDDDSNPCGCCKKLAKSKVWRLPCLRLKINDVILSKTSPVKGYEWTRRWKDGMVADEISSWASDEIKTIRVTEGFTGRSVELRVREFVPQEGDRLDRSWVVDGVRRSVKIPAFALVDMEAVKDSYDAYIKNGIVECCKKLVNKEKKLLWRVYSLAIQRLGDGGMDKQDRELLLNTLELWMSVRLTTTSFEIVGRETLGMTHDLMDETSPLSGKIPLPPVMGAQLDSILIHQIQAKCRHETLELLQTITQEKKKESWLVTYLVTFVLLHNIALVIQHDASYARKHGIGRRFAREDRVKDYYVGAMTLLVYFHYRRRADPFAPGYKIDKMRGVSGNEAADFVEEMRKYVREHETRWRDLVESGEIENEYYFVAQMHEQKWLPRSWPG